MHYKKIEIQEMNVVAQLHQKIFSTYFLTNLGAQLLEKYYQTFAESKTCIFLGAYTEQWELVGFILITSTYNKSLKKFYQKYGLKLGFQILKKSICCNHVILDGMKERIFRFIKKSKSSGIREEQTTLLSIGVDSEHRGKGIASELIRQVESYLYSKGVQSYGLSVKKENICAKALYKRKGFIQIGETIDLEYYCKFLAEPNPIRILHLPNSLLKSSGIMSVIMSYYRSIDKEKVQFDFLCFASENNDYKDEIHLLGGRTYCADMSLASNLVALHKWVKNFLVDHANEYSVIHYHAISIWGLWLNTFRRKGIKHVITHSHATKFSDKKWNAIRNRILCLPVKWLANHWFACSNAAGELLYGKKAVLQKKIFLLHNAISVEKFRFSTTKRNEIRVQLGLENNFVIGHVGRFSPEKNHNFLIDIFAEIRKMRPDSKLMLVGEGPLQESIREKVLSLGLSDNVLFMGQRSDVADLMCAMDVFILPSVFEGLGIVLIEAQATGLTCIASNVVPRDANVGKNVIFLSLRESFQKWAGVAVTSGRTQLDEDPGETLTYAGYNISDNAKILEDYYKGLR